MKDLSDANHRLKRKIGQGVFLQVLCKERIEGREIRGTQSLIEEGLDRTGSRLKIRPFLGRSSKGRPLMDYLKYRSLFPLLTRVFFLFFWCFVVVYGQGLKVMIPTEIHVRDFRSSYEVPDDLTHWTVRSSTKFWPSRPLTSSGFIPRWINPNFLYTETHRDQWIGRGTVILTKGRGGGERGEGRRGGGTRELLHR